MSFKKSLTEAYTKVSVSDAGHIRVAKVCSTTDAYVCASLSREIIIRAFSTAEAGQKTFELPVDMTIVVSERHFARNINLKVSDELIQEFCEMYGFKVRQIQNKDGEPCYQIQILE